MQEVEQLAGILCSMEGGGIWRDIQIWIFLKYLFLEEVFFCRKWEIS